jgi:predicted DNA-binding transcriptional regulator YafY
MYFSTSRALAVLELLQNYGLMRGEDIAARLEVDARTVRRYILILRERGVPIDMRRGRHGGYSLAPGYRAPLALTKDEALALAYGLLSVEPRGRGVTPGDSKRALRKVARALPAMTRDLIQVMDGSVTFATPVMGGEALAVPQHLETAVRAIRSRSQLDIRHRGQDGAETERTVDPSQVVHRYGRWYLVGYCHLREDLRVFRLDHILNARTLAGKFTPTPVDALAAVERSLAQVPWGWEFQVIAHLTPEEVSERLAPTIAVRYPHAQGTLLHGFADDLAPLAYTLAGLDCPIEIIKPIELRAALLDLANRIHATVEQFDSTAGNASERPPAARR